MPAAPNLVTSTAKRLRSHRQRTRQRPRFLDHTVTPPTTQIGGLFCLFFRVPVHRAGDTDALCGRRLDVGGCQLTTGARQRRELRPAGTVFARYVVDEASGDEERFVERVASELEARSVTARKLLCGRSHRIGLAHGMLTARSLLIADLGHDESLAIQCSGIGPGRLLGCGLFVPHKDIGPARRMDGDG